MTVGFDNFRDWSDKLESDVAHALGSTVLKNYNAEDVLLDKKRLQKVGVCTSFNTGVKDVPGPITNQKSSGRCWLFAGTNELRSRAVSKLEGGIKEFELSQAYLFFYDKLEKAYYFLSKIIETRDEEVGSRIVQFLLTSPVEDGGQYSMFINLVAKYGIIPKDLYGDLPYSTTASGKWNELYKSKLREYAEVLRTIPKDEIEAKFAEMQKEIFKLHTLFMDLPPVGPNDEFEWSYTDKENVVRTIKTTPLKFAQEYCNVNPKNVVSVVNDPRHAYGTVLHIEHLGNIVGAEGVTYLNVDNETLTSLLIKKLKDGKPVFFGSHTPKFMYKQSGVLDVELWNYKALGYSFNQKKASRLHYGESLMTHAMLITNVHLDDDGKPVRYRVENSWGKDTGKDGFYTMTQEYFEEYSFQIVVDVDDLPESLANKLDQEPIKLPIWDPMGALAR